MRRCSTVLAAISVSALACSSPDLSAGIFRCESDADCAEGHVCASSNGQLACLDVASTPIRLGMSGPLQGTSGDLGNEMRRGIEAQLAQVNREGGIYGREVTLTARNDNYDPDDAVEATRALLDVIEVRGDDEPDVRGGESVFALIGNIGTPTMLRTAPLATKNQVIFFGPFTGSQEYLRDGTDSPYVYNYRAGYYDETAAMVDYLTEVRIPTVLSASNPDYRRVVVFAQNDSYGDAGYRGVVTAYNQRFGDLPAVDAILRVGYERENVASVSSAVAQSESYFTTLLGEAAEDVPVPVAILMIDTYLPGERYIRELKDWINRDAARARRLQPVFMHVSFVGSDSLAEALTADPATYTDINTGLSRSYTEQVMVTQVVPTYDSQASGVQAYRDHMADYDGNDLSFTSLEGYIVARLFTDALRLNGPNLTTRRFIDTLDTSIRDHDLGIGTLLSFSSTDHQASSTVWGSQLESDGTFSVPFVWDRQAGIESN